MEVVALPQRMAAVAVVHRPMFLPQHPYLVIPVFPPRPVQLASRHCSFQRDAAAAAAVVDGMGV